MDVRLREAEIVSGAESAKAIAFFGDLDTVYKRQDRSNRLIRWTMAATILLPLVLFGYASLLNWTAVNASADREIMRTLDVAYEHALKVFETIDLSLLQTEETIRDRSDSPIRDERPAIHGRLRCLAQALPQIKSL